MTTLASTMLVTSALVASARRLLLDPENRGNGLQMAATIVLAYAASLAAGLPEPFWAVMGALIVVRPNLASTFDAGLTRMYSTLFGAACGLLGVWLGYLGANQLAATLAIVAVLAYVSAVLSVLRGAPVAALIVLSAAGPVGHAALEVAFLRVLQIVIGIGVAIAISKALAGYRATDRLHAGCAGILRGAGLRLAQVAAQTGPNDSDAESAGGTARRALDRLAALAGSADRVSRLFRRPVAASDDRYHRRIAGLTSRVFQDVAVFNRVLRAASGQEDDGLLHEAARVAGAAVVQTADMIEGAAPSDLDCLHRLAGNLILNAGDGKVLTGPAALLMAPLHLLLEDLRLLCQCVRKRPRSSRRRNSPKHPKPDWRGHGFR